MADDAAAFLGFAGEETAGVHEGDERDVEDIAEADEPRAFIGSVDVESSGFLHRLVGDDANDDALDAGEADDEVFGPVHLDFKEVAGVHEAFDDFVNIDRLLAVGGNEFVHAGVLGHIERSAQLMGRVHDVVGRQEAEELLGKGNGVGVVAGDEVHVAADAGVCRRAADFVHGDDFTGGRLDDFGSADEHVGLLVHHDLEIGEGRGVSRAARARSGDDGDLGHDARGFDVLVEHLAVAGERADPFLDARATRIVEGDDGHAVFDGVIDGLANFLGVHVAERSA